MRFSYKKVHSYWDRRINIAHRKINRKKYYGVGVEIEKYVEVIRDNVNVDEAVDILRQRRGESVNKEDVTEQIAQMVAVSHPDTDNEMFLQLHAVLGDSFRKGTRRLFTRDGARVDVEQFVDDDALSQLMNAQSEYLNNMNNDLQKVVSDTLGDGFRQGKGMDEIGRELEQNVDQFTRNRANTIARSEVIKASSEGTEATMQKAGVDKFMWLSARDSKVCEAGSFSENFQGTEYTSCREYDGTFWQINMPHPKPVLHSHPNCRCTLVADV